MNTAVPGAGKFILVVEDEFTVRETFREALESDGYEVDTAENGKVALEKLRAGRRPNLILLDMSMPILDGGTFLRMLLADLSLALIPVVVISAIASPENTVGAKAFMKKPPDLEALLKLVKAHLS